MVEASSSFCILKIFKQSNVLKILSVSLVNKYLVPFNQTNEKSHILENPYILSTLFP